MAAEDIITLKVALSAVLESADGAAIDVTKAPYNADNSGMVDCGAAITSAAAALSTAGGGTLFFPTGVYKIFDTSGGNLAVFTGIHGIRILGYGATLAVSVANSAILTTASYGVIFYFVNCTNVLIDGFKVTGPDIASTFGGGSVGIDVIQIREATTNVCIPNLDVSGAQSAVLLPGMLTLARRRNIWIGNLKVSNSYYGVAGYYGIDGLTIEHLDTDTVGRSLFLYGGVYNVKATILSKNPNAVDVLLLTTLLTTGVGAGLENITIKYVRRRDSDQETDASVPCAKLAWGSSNPATIRNVNFDFDVDYPAAGASGSGLLEVAKYQAGGAIDDVTDRGHKLYGLRISGTVTGSPSNPSGAMIRCSAGARWGTSLDAWYGLVLRDLFISNGSIDLDVAAVRDTVIVHNVTIPNGTLKLVKYSTALPVSQWKTRPFVASNYTASGAMVWSVAAGDIGSETWMLVGRTMTFTFVISNTTVGGVPDYALRIALPVGFRATSLARANIRIKNNGAFVWGYCTTTAGATYLSCILSNAVNFFAATDATSVEGQLTFEVYQ